MGKTTINRTGGPALAAGVPSQPSLLIINTTPVRPRGVKILARGFGFDVRVPRPSGFEGRGFWCGRVANPAQPGLKSEHSSATSKTPQNAAIAFDNKGIYADCIDGGDARLFVGVVDAF